MIKCFVPLSDELLYDPEALKAYRLIPYNSEYLRPNPFRRITAKGGRDRTSRRHPHDREN